MSNKYPSVPPKTLAVDLSSTGSLLRLTDILDWGALDLTTASFQSDYIPATLINDAGTSVEFILITASTIASAITTGATIYKRGLNYYATGVVATDQTEVTANKLDWTANDTKVLLGTHTPYLLSRFANKDNTESVLAAWTFAEAFTPRSASTHTYIAGEELFFATKEYVDGVALSGAPNASTTVKGVAEEATDAELQAGTATGGTGARLFAGGASHTQTATANKVVVGKSNAKIDDGWLGLTTAGDLVYSDGTDPQRLALGTTGLYLRAGASAPAWGGANLDEANTFFGATDITGAEAETLSSGSASDASALHTHNFKFTIGSASHTSGGGNQTIAHGLGRVPKFVRITCTADGANDLTTSSHGHATTTSDEECVYEGGAGVDSTSGVSVGNILQLTSGASNLATASLGTLDATNIVLTMGTDSTNFSILWEVWG